MIIIAGIARSGLTVTMQMLHAGGIPCVGEWPAFEPYGFEEIPWTECRGKAVKLVDAHLQIPPDGEYDVIRLHRDAQQQARSQIKFAQAILGRSLGTSVNRMAKSFAADYAVIDEWAKKHRTLHLYFEDIIRQPAATAAKLAEWLRTPVDIEKMAACVVKRKADCHPTLLEIEFVEGAR